MHDEAHPNSGDVVIWDVEPDDAHSIYWVRVQGRGGAAHVFEGPDAWAHARSTAEALAGSEGIIWKRHKDGHFQKLEQAISY